jgi:hypothetical protein
MAKTIEVWLRDELQAGTWLRGPYGRGLTGTLGAALDAVVDAQKQAVKVRHVATAPDDALDALGNDRLLERYPIESPATYRARLGGAWAAWEFGGTRQGVVAALAAAGITATVHAWREMAWPPHPYEAWWSAFWVDVTAHPFASDGLWGDPGTWGDIVPGHNGAPAAPGVWGSDANVVEVAALRNAVRKWKSGHEICAAIRFYIGTDRWDATAPWAHGTWGDTELISWAG